MTLTDHQKTTIAHSLQVAADHWGVQIHQTDNPSLQQTFTRRAQEARALAEAVEVAKAVELKT